MKQSRKHVSTFLMVSSLLPFSVCAQTEKLTEKEIESNVVRNYFVESRNEVESSRLDYIIPDTYKRAYPAEFGYSLDVFEKVRTLRSYYLSQYTPDPAPEVPDQFKSQKIISGEEQERIIEDEAAEKLYKEQSDPLYFEKSNEMFQQEFNRRMQNKNLKQ